MTNEFLPPLSQATMAAVSSLARSIPSQEINLDALTAEMAGINPVQQQLVDVDAILELQPPASLIDDILSVGELAVLYGQYGCGKSFVALDWAMCIGAWLPWQGREVRGGQVIYIVGEGVSGMSQRVRAWVEYYGVDVAPSVMFHKGPLNLLDKEQVKYLAQTVSEMEAKLVVFDTLARCIGRGDENSGQDMGAAIEAMNYVQAHGATVLVIHHLNKLGDIRGHSSLPGAVDHMISMWKNDDYNTHWLKCRKSKDLMDFQPIPLRLRSVQLNNGSSCVVSAA